MNAKLLARLPKTIELGYKTFDLKLLDADYNHHTVGSMDFIPGVITIAHTKQDAAHEIVNTVIHEPLHAIWRMLSLGCDPDYEERAVTGIANGFTDLLRRNPGYRRWINDALESET